MLPILAQMASWGVKYLPVSEELGIRAQLLGAGGPKMWAGFMDETARDPSRPETTQRRPELRSANGCRRRMRRWWQGATRGETPITIICVSRRSWTFAANTASHPMWKRPVPVLTPHGAENESAKP
jgi:hypothetical protein